MCVCGGGYHWSSVCPGRVDLTPKLLSHPFKGTQYILICIFRYVSCTKILEHTNLKMKRTFRLCCFLHDHLVTQIVPQTPDSGLNVKWIQKHTSDHCLFVVTVQKCVSPLSDMSKVPTQETRGNSSWITPAPADLNWGRQRGVGRDRLAASVNL